VSENPALQPRAGADAVVVMSLKAEDESAKPFVETPVYDSQAELEVGKPTTSTVIVNCPEMSTQEVIKNVKWSSL